MRLHIDDRITRLTVAVVAADVYKKKCLKDETVPEYPRNVYYCYETSKSECCVRDMQHTCCEPEESIMKYVDFRYCSSSLHIVFK